MENRKGHILAVDDKKDNLIVLGALLEEMFPNVEYHTETDPLKAIERCRDINPDILLLDVVMPELDGYEICKIVKQDDDLKYIPVVMITAARTDKSGRIEALNAGADAFLTKPLDELELIAIMRSMFRIKDSENLNRTEKGRLEEMVKARTQQLELQIEERKLVEVERANERNLLRTLVDYLPEAIYVKDVKARKILANKRDCLNLGFEDEKDVIGKDDFAFFEEDIARRFYEDDMKVIRDGKPLYDHQQVYIDEDGEESCYLASKIPLVNDKGEVTGLVGISRDITEERRIQQKLVQLTKGVEQSSASILITNAEGIIEYVNQKFIAVSGFDKNEIIGKKPNILKSEFTDPSQHKALWQTITSGNEWEGEFANKRKNGEIFWEHCLISCVKDEEGNIKNYIGIKEDITKQKEAESNVKRLSIAMEQSPAAVYITDTDGIIEYVNNKCVDLSGYSEKELLGVIHPMFDPKHTSESVRSIIMERVNSGQAWQGEYRNEHKDGTKFWESLLISSIKDENEGISNLIVVAEDVSMRKKLQAELLEAKEKAEESDRLKTAFLNNMSHEIRTPLNAIVGFSELMKDVTQPPEMLQYYCNLVQGGSDQLLAIINDIISISTIEAGKIKAYNKEYDVYQSLKNLESQYVMQLKDKDVVFSMRIELSADEFNVISDETKVTQVVTNLINNAIKYTPEGTIECGVKRKGADLYFWVEDSGVGIRPDLHDTIFERFRQGDDAHLYGGNGLGLSISQSYIDILGGDINLEASEPGKGSRFFFTIPYEANVMV